MAYTLTPKEYKGMKSRLTRCLNKKEADPEALLREAKKTLARFEEVGFPDDWSRWERAKEDAELAIRLRSGSRYRMAV